ncbi:hypothetical protein [Prolixibacter bellariivorans]|uniref:hypothetical protein n=1 Tax=Prolixibacter bellariivorans TaxID=314319 RepID=UPI000566B799|nr:hypothetical protein [Prolixibacter bellariivorans]
MGGHNHEIKTKTAYCHCAFPGGCSTGSMVTSGYVDDIYYSPGDTPPPVVAHTSVSQPKQTTPQREQVVSNIKESANGKTVDNYVLKDGSSNSYGNIDEYYYNDQPDYADTTYYNDDDSVKYVINNYYEPSDNMSYSSRIRRFHDPYFYDPTGIVICGIRTTTDHHGALAGVSDGAAVGIIPGIMVGDLLTPTTVGVGITVPGIMVVGGTRTIPTMVVGEVTHIMAGDIQLL